jgi:hypothetical protein
MWRVTSDDSAQTNDGVNGATLSQNLGRKGHFECAWYPMFDDVCVDNTAALEST